MNAALAALEAAAVRVAPNMNSQDVAKLTFGDLDRIWKSHTITWKLKGRLFSAFVRALCCTTLKYGLSRKMTPHFSREYTLA